MFFKRIVIGVMALMVIITAMAQADSVAEKQLQRFVFQSVAQGGMLEGEKGTSLQLQWINGFQHKTWFGGIGVGLDYYFQRSIPLFAHVKRDVSKRVPLFVYGDLGMHFAWVKKDVENDWYNSEFKNGLFYEAGLGYRARVNTRNAIVFSAGYSEKAMAELRKEPYIWGPPGMPQRTNRFDYRLRRISIKAGFKF
jgi:hypothetical protein